MKDDITEKRPLRWSKIKNKTKKSSIKDRHTNRVSQCLAVLAVSRMLTIISADYWGEVARVVVVLRSRIYDVCPPN